MVYNLARNIMKYGDLYLNEGPREKRQKNQRMMEKGKKMSTITA